MNCGLVGVGFQALISPLTVSARESNREAGSNLNKEQNSFIDGSQGRVRVSQEPSVDR